MDMMPSLTFLAIVAWVCEEALCSLALSFL